MAGSRAAPPALILQLTTLVSLALASGIGGGKSGLEGLGDPTSCSVQSAGTSWGLRGLPRGARASRPAAVLPGGGASTTGAARRIRPGVQAREGASCCGLRRNSCRQRLGEKLP